MYINKKHFAIGVISVTSFIYMLCYQASTRDNKIEAAQEAQKVNKEKALLLLRERIYKDKYSGELSVQKLKNTEYILASSQSSLHGSGSFFIFVGDVKLDKQSSSEQIIHNFITFFLKDKENKIRFIRIPMDKVIFEEKALASPTVELQFKTIGYVGFEHCSFLEVFNAAESYLIRAKAEDFLK